MHYYWLSLSLLFIVGLNLNNNIIGCFCQQQQQQQQQQYQKSKEEYQKDIIDDPRNSIKRFQFGWYLLVSGGGPGGPDAGLAIHILQSCFNTNGQNEVDTDLGQVDPLKGYLASSMIGRYMHEQRNYDISNQFLSVAYDISKQKLSPNHDVSELCVHLQLSSQFNYFPLTVKEADTAISKIELYQNELLQLMDIESNPMSYNKDVYLNENWLSNTIPGVQQDPYSHCMYDIFELSFYYRANTKQIAYQHYKLTSLAWPQLSYVAKHVQEYDDGKNKALLELESSSATNTQQEQEQQNYQKCIEEGEEKERTTGKINLAVISGTLSEGHSVSEDFGGILSRLDRTKFDVTYIYIHENTSPNQGAAKFTSANPQDSLHHYVKNPSIDNGNGAWIKRIGIDIAENRQKFTKEFDMILYLDLTMSTYCRRLGMMRLAPVQINTHGHPVTSGHPSDVIQHFISWSEAELPLEQSQSHYTEQLQLIPKGKIHQYYTPRIIQEEGTGILRSRMDGMRFDHLLRKDFHELPPYIKDSNELDDIINTNNSDNNMNLYVCMQKPFKLMPEFDGLVCGILAKDLNGHVILHKEESTYHHKTFVQRMMNAGCDMSRIHFISSQPNHKLLKLYSTANVVLDSYPAGGCTTTREAIELGKAVVTWPARLLGGRWTLGLYNIIELEEETKTKLIASSKDEYIAKAVEIGTNSTLRRKIELEIKDKTKSNLFYRQEAVEEWEKILLRISPVKQCANSNVSSSSPIILSSEDNDNDDGNNNEDDTSDSNTASNDEL
jgi:predicted O-linked N-acetylglucosamine transferase (SPINDLY family)